MREVGSPSNAWPFWNGPEQQWKAMAVTGCKRMTIGKTVTGAPLFPESERKGAYPSSCVEIRNKWRRRRCPPVS